jgi:ankyrin repeat protein
MIDGQKMYISTCFSKIVRLNIRLQTCLWLSCLMIACGADPSDPAQEEKKPVELSLAEISRVNELGQNLLLKAVLENDIELLLAVIAKGIDLNGRDKSGNAALHYALRSKNHDALKILIDHGADLSLPLPNGDSPLKFAVTKNDFVAAEALHLCDRNPDILLTKDSAIGAKHSGPGTGRG